MLSSSFAQQFLNEKSYISVNTIFETIWECDLEYHEDILEIVMVA